MFFKKKEHTKNVEWIPLNSSQQLDDIIAESSSHPVLIFKHSTRCSISSTALNRFEQSWISDDNNSIAPYYLDLLNHRDISNSIERVFGVMHQSPQAIVIRNGKAIHNSSHFDISFDTILNDSKK